MECTQRNLQINFILYKKAGRMIFKAKPHKALPHDLKTFAPDGVREQLPTVGELTLLP